MAQANPLFAPLSTGPPSGAAASATHSSYPRLTEEYDAAQERGEVAGHGGKHGNQFANVDTSNVATAADLGLRRDEIHEARRMRDAEMRLAEEYDAAQERGEMAKSGQRGKAVSGENSFWTPKGSPEFEDYRNERPPLMDRPATYGDLEFSAKDIHEARQMRAR